MKKISFLFLLIFLSSCATTADDYMSMSPRELCIGWWERLGGNIHAKPMGEAIDRRGINCDQYMEAMIEAKRSRDAFYDGLKENLKTSERKTTNTNKPANCTTRKVGGYIRTFCY